ncbi:MAG: hypothetical protein ABNH26_13360 [Celeribacter sp.]
MVVGLVVLGERAGRGALKVWANDAYLHATERSRKDIIGRRMFDEFPSKPEGGPGRMLRASFKRVLEDGVTDHLPLISYPIPGPDRHGRCCAKIHQTGHLSTVRHFVEMPAGWEL